MLWKVCRVRDIATARLCADLGADFLGLHAVHSLPAGRERHYRRIIRELQQYYPATQPVLVTKTTNPSTLVDMVNRTAVTLIQVHAPVDGDALTAIRNRLCRETTLDVRFIVLVSVDAPVDPVRIESLLHLPFVQYFLIDSRPEGGSGQQASVDQLQACLPLLPRGRILIAGGLTPQNVRSIIEQYHPDGVDVQSGLEKPTPSRPKDPLLLRQFRTQVKQKGPWPTPPTRPWVSVSLSSVPMERAREMVKRFGCTDIDSVHLDHADGSVASPFRAAPFHVAEAMASLSPCLPYELHLMMEGSGQTRKDILTRYLALNPMLRVAYLHCRGIGNRFGETVREFVSLTERMGIRPGVAFLGSAFTPPLLEVALQALSFAPIQAVSLVLRSGKLPRATVHSVDRQLVQLLAGWAQKNGPIQVGVDRDMTIAKLRTLAPIGLHQVTVGSELLQASRPQLQITRLRSMLIPPTR